MRQGKRQEARVRIAREREREALKSWLTLSLLLHLLHLLRRIRCAKRVGIEERERERVGERGLREIDCMGEQTEGEGAKSMHE